MATRTDQLARPPNATLGYGFDTYNQSTTAKSCINFEVDVSSAEFGGPR
jgi:hypothetical protein